MGLSYFSSDNYDGQWYCERCNAAIGATRKACEKCGENKYITNGTPPGNPNPENYKVLRSLQLGKYLIVIIQYPDCKNYEGKKIMVYESDIETLLAQKKIDPHFSNNTNFKSPIARFVPNYSGWNMAKILCVSLTADEKKYRKWLKDNI